MKKKTRIRLRRPQPPPTDATTRSNWRKYVEDGTLHQARFIYYYSVGWFARLEETNEWLMRDLAKHGVIMFISLVRHEATLADNDPQSMRRVARVIRTNIIDLLTRSADELDRRAEVLELEDSEAEASD
jgi:hypothetical protein